MSTQSSSQTWKKESGYIWSLIGSAVGFANVLSFSALCYKNGGGAFLIPYLIAHLLVGIPMLFLEGFVGQKFKLPQVGALGRNAGNWGKNLGWLAVLSCATIGGFYIVLTGFSLAYMLFSATGGLPTTDSALFFKDVFLQDTGSLTKIGGISWGLLFPALGVIAFTGVVLVRNIQSGIEKLCSIFLPLLAVMILLFSCIVSFLPGAFIGIQHYLFPDFSQLARYELWRDVFGQVFFSLSLGLGIVTGYSRYNPDSFNIPRAMFQVALGDFIISVLSGFAIFGCIGFMSAQSGIAFDQLVPSDSAFEIGFVVFPTILNQFGPFFSKIFGTLFFFCVFIAGITGVFSIVESVVGNLSSEFSLPRRQSVVLTLAGMTAITVPFCLGNGQHLIGSLAPMVLGITMLIGGIAEIFIYLFLSQEIQNASLWRNNNKRTWPTVCLRYFVLPLLLIVLAGALIPEISSLQRGDLSAIIRWSWLIAAILISFNLTRAKNITEIVGETHTG